MSKNATAESRTAAPVVREIDALDDRGDSAARQARALSRKIIDR
jgi:hypothetical protein